MGLYRCPYILRTGKVCGRGCNQPEGCKLHRNSPTRIPCKEYGCGKLNYSKYGACRDHASKYRKREYYQQKKQDVLCIQIAMIENRIPDLPDSRHEL